MFGTVNQCTDCDIVDCIPDTTDKDDTAGSSKRDAQDIGTVEHKVHADEVIHQTGTEIATGIKEYRFKIQLFCLSIHEISSK